VSCRCVFRCHEHDPVDVFGNRVPAGHYRAEGWVKNYNTFEEYKNADRTKVLDLAARNVGFLLESPDVVG
jgi:ubiquitin-like modifier-activating enzyme ATG7